MSATALSSMLAKIRPPMPFSSKQANITWLLIVHFIFSLFVLVYDTQMGPGYEKVSSWIQSAERNLDTLLPLNLTFSMTSVIVLVLICLLKVF